MVTIDISFIKGIMFGMEYYEDLEEELFFVVLDLGILRFLYVRYTVEVE